MNSTQYRSNTCNHMYNKVGLLKSEEKGGGGVVSAWLPSNYVIDGFHFLRIRQRLYKFNRSQRLKPSSNSISKAWTVLYIVCRATLLSTRSLWVLTTKPKIWEESKSLDGHYIWYVDPPIVSRGILSFPYGHSR